ncbi:cupin domain-containing protein [Bacillus sp. Marseille-P3800]|uniref:cupin domain-containing protein n=1 Tax=Bacillus sp. Marseille-P3800 TaxID=2014782 RepID=UPI000C069B6D|nr:cupin domain-containing protein [Bacillus sp. Marseille-P3800]
MRDLNQVKVKQHYFNDDGRVPNHPSYPFVHYQAVFENEDSIEDILKENHWYNSWRGGIFDYHHYHSNAHEVLVVVEGEATLQVGGVSGEQLEVGVGDVLILPAGTGHKFIDGSESFAVIGAYPEGVPYDLCTGDPAEKEKHIQKITEVPKPSHDPVFGEHGPLSTLW